MVRTGPDAKRKSIASSTLENWEATVRDWQGPDVRTNFETAIGREISFRPGLSVLDQVSDIVQFVDRSLYEAYEKVARERVLPRDPDDWPIGSVALCWIFQSGQKIRIFLAAASALGLPTGSSCTFAPTEIRNLKIGRSETI